MKCGDPGEALFKRYLQSNGYEMLAYEYDLGTVKRPDFLIRAAGHEVVVEVESFNTPPMPPTVRSGFVNKTPKLRAVSTATSCLSYGLVRPSALCQSANQHVTALRPSRSRSSDEGQVLAE